MILDTTKKFGIFMNPKTGTSSLRIIFKQIEGLQICKHDHHTPENFIQRYDLKEDFSDYKFYCFYRDPVDRFLSAYSGILEWYGEHKEIACSFDGRTMNRFLGLMLSDPFYLNMDFSTEVPTKQPFGTIIIGRPLPNDIKNRIKNISILDFISKIDRLFGNVDRYVTSKQVRWLDHPNIELLDYTRFNEHVHNFLKLYDKDTVPILHKRARNLEYGKRRDDLTPEELLAIQTYYKEDYIFFKKHNITF